MGLSSEEKVVARTTITDIERMRKNKRKGRATFLIEITRYSRSPAYVILFSFGLS